MCAVSTSTAAPAAERYHHGDLRAALLEAAAQLLEAGEPFSLRAIARRAGVSATAPYRHFADRQALESALAVEGFKELGVALAAKGAPTSVADLAELAVEYVDFALDRSELFRLMFGQPCDDTNDQRVAAAGDLHVLLADVLRGALHTATDDRLDALATGAWGLVHGLAFLHLDGKLDATDRRAVAERVRAAVTATLG